MCGACVNFTPRAASRCVRGRDVGHAQVENRFLRARAAFLAQHEPGAAAVEERERSERVEMRQAEHLAVPRLRRLDVAHRTRDLADGPRRVSRFVSTGSPPRQARCPRGARNHARSSRRLRRLQLRQRIGDVKLHRVHAHTAPPRDLGIGHAVLHGVHRAPLGRRQQVGVRRTAARAFQARSSWHPRVRGRRISLPGHGSNG